MNRLPLWSGLLAVLLLLPFTLRAAPAVELHDSADGIIPLSNYARYLHDPDGRLQLDDVMSRTDAFLDSGDTQELNFGYTRGAIWLKVDVHASVSRIRQYMLEFQYAYLDDIRLYIVRSGQTEAMRSGRSVPVNDWPVDNRKPVFPLLIHPDENLTLYIRGASHAALAMSVRLMTQKGYAQYNNRTLVLLSLYFGMLIALGSYNFLLFLGLRQRIFLLYTVFVFTFGFSASSMNGIGPLVLWPGSAGWDRIVPTGYSTAAALAVMFARRFLNMATRAPRWDRLLQLAIPLWWGGAALTLIADVQTALKIMSIQGVMTTLLLLSAGIAAVRRRIPAAWIFVTAWSLLLVGTALLSVRNAGLLPSNFFTVYSMQIGSAAEMLLLSFALAARFSDLKRQKEKAQQALVNTLTEQERILERRVTERTAELEDAKVQLERMVTEDALTGLANRNGLRQHFGQMKIRAQRRPYPLAVILIDLDDFKPVNDRYGHEAGDELLVVIAERLRHELRGSDMAGRLGGDEFVLLVDDPGSADHLQALGQRLLDAITQPVDIGRGRQASVRASIGICYSLAGGETLKSLLRCADEAMYKIKHHGKNGIGIADKVTLQP